MFKSAVVSSTAAQLILSEGDNEFIRFANQYGKNYATREEFEIRSKLFQERLAAVREHNAQVEDEDDHRLGINAFADLTEAEWANMRGSRVVQRDGPFVDFADVKLDDAGINWYEKGMVNDPKDQGSCGSCWAFSATGAVESSNAIAGKGLNSLSEQQLVDCDKEYNLGCQGGLMTYAFDYLQEHPQMLEADYPYIGNHSPIKCLYVASKGVGTVIDYDQIKPNDPNALKGALMRGPVSVSVDAQGIAWQLYEGGVMKKFCGTKLNHAVLAVGYGTTKKGVEYYIVKNSYGSKWGEHGFVRIAVKDGKGVCGIQMDASQPYA